MEEHNSMQWWLEQFVNDREQTSSSGEAAFKKKVGLAEEFFLPRYGQLTCPEMTDEVLYELLGEAKRSLSGNETFSLFSLLKSLFSYIEANSEETLPDLTFDDQFVPEEGLTEIETYFLDDAILSKNDRAHLCYWLAIHTALPVKEICKLSVKQFALKKYVLTITLEKKSRSKKAKTVTNEIKLSLNDQENAWWKKNLRLYGKDTCLLISGNSVSANRRKLQATLTELGESNGFRDLTLEKLEATNWKQNEIADAEEYFLTPEEPIDETIVETPDVSAKGKKKRAAPIPKKKLNAIVRSFPVPVLEHARRCKQITSFIVEQIQGEKWFLEYDVQGNQLANAVYYHDLGKSALKLDDYFLDVHATSAQAERYMEHVSKGLEVLQKNAPVGLGEYTAESYDGMIRDAIADHHETFDGKGFPDRKKGNEISLAGRMSAVADELDRRLFIAKTDSETVVTWFAEQSGKQFDPLLVQAVTDHADAFLAFIREMQNYYASKRNTDEYGMRYRFLPYIDLESREVAAWDSKLFLNDPYYGLINADIILPVVDDQPKFLSFKMLALERLCRLIGESNETNHLLPPIIYNLSLKEVEKESYFKELFEIFVNTGIRFRQIIFAVSEEDIVGKGLDISGLSNDCHLIGAHLAIREFGGETTLLPSLNRIRPDYLILKKKYADASGNIIDNDMMQNIMRMAAKLNITVFCSGVESEEQVEKLKEFGVGVASGSIAGEECAEADLLK